jgi:hypothetical protein
MLQYVPVYILLVTDDERFCKYATDVNIIYPFITLEFNMTHLQIEFIHILWQLWADVNLSGFIVQSYSR